MSQRREIDKTEQEALCQDDVGSGPGTCSQVEDSSPASPGRRRFVTGVATGSVLMTVASKPVMGGGGVWCTPSGWVSGNLSQANRQQSCGGKSPGYWGNHPEAWPWRYVAGTCKYAHEGTCKEYKSDGTPFHSGVVNSKGLQGVFYGSTFDSMTLMQVILAGGNGDPYQLGAHICAALFNAATVPDYGMDEDMVKEIWYQLVTQGFYQPSTGDPMYPQDVISFIQNTFGYDD